MGKRTCSVEWCSSDAWARGWCGRHYARWRNTGSPITPSHQDPPAVKFDRNVQVGPECWEWVGSKDVKGYGVMKIAGVTYAAHRMAFERAHGPIPSGAYICHKCDNPPCVNPAHLYVGTHADNMRDKVSRGRCSSLPGESNPFAKLTAERVGQVRSLYATGRFTQRELARHFSIAQSHVGRIVRGEAWIVQPTEGARSCPASPPFGAGNRV